MACDIEVVWEVLQVRVGLATHNTSHRNEPSSALAEAFNHARTIFQHYAPADIYLVEQLGFRHAITIPRG